VVTARYTHAAWDTVLRCGPELVQPGAVAAAKQHGVRLTVCDARGVGTEIGPGPDRLERAGRATGRAS